VAAESHDEDVILNCSVTDNCDASIAPTITITSDQHERKRPWHHPEIDWKVLDPHHLLLRAEINPPSKTGRTYTITVTATDSAGSTGSSSVDVKVFPKHHFPSWDKH
jgi:hypothetical protein